MKQFVRFHLFLIGLLVWVFGMGASVSADTEALPSGVIIGDDTGLKVGDDGKYFIEHTDIKPGLTFKKEISISNYSQEEGDFDLKLDMKVSDSKGKVDLLKAISVRIELEGKLIYEGDLTGTPTGKSAKPPIDLGHYQVGDMRTLIATFRVSNDLPKSDWEKASSADFFWVFYGTRPTVKPKPKPDPIPPILKKILPKTGEDWRNVLIGMCVGIVLVCLLLIIAKRRQTPRL